MTRKTPSFKMLIACVIIVFGAQLSLPVYGQNWVGGAGDDFWSNAANWSPGFPVSPGSLVFANTIYTNSVNDRGSLTYNIEFGDGGPFRISGDSIRLGGLDSSGNVFDGSIVVGAATSIPHSIALNELILVSSSTISVIDGGAISVTSNISGASNLSKSGGGALTLAGDNSFDGLVSVSGGKLIVQSENALGSTISGSRVNSGATLAIEGGVALSPESLSLNGVGVGGKGALQNIAGDNTLTGGVIVESSSRINSMKDTLTIDVQSGHAIVSGHNRLDIGGEGNIVLKDSVSSNQLVWKDGNGVLTFDSGDSYIEAMNVGQGTVSLLEAASISGGSITVDEGAKLSVAVSSDVFQSEVFTSLHGRGEFVKTGTGSLTMNVGTNLWMGDISLFEGGLVFADRQWNNVRDTFVSRQSTLTVNGFLNSGYQDSFLNVEGTLSGTGFVANMDVLISGIHAPGSGVGAMKFSGVDLSYESGAKVHWGLFDNTTASRGRQYNAFDLSSGSLDFWGNTKLKLIFDSFGSNVDWTDTFWGSSQSWVVYDLEFASISNFSRFSIEGTDWLDKGGRSLSLYRPGSGFRLEKMNEDVVLRYDYGINAVPEPGALGLLSVLGGFGGFRLVKRYFRGRKFKANC